MVIPMDWWMEGRIMCSLDAWFSPLSFSKLAIVTSILLLFSLRNWFIFKGRQKIENTVQCVVMYWMSESKTVVKVHHPLSWKRTEGKGLRRLGFMVTVQPTDVAEQNIGKWLTHRHTENLMKSICVNSPSAVRSALLDSKGISIQQTFLIKGIIIYLYRVHLEQK